MSISIPAPRAPRGVVGIINSGKDSNGGHDGSPTLDNSSESKSHHDAKQIAHAPHPALRSPNAEREWPQAPRCSAARAGSTVRLRTAARLVDTDDTKTMKNQHPHDTEGM
jgi:hypothetical protein